MGSQPEQPSIGLRERKKQKTRALIQQHALMLFRTQGYAATTVEQIAAAAEISPSTFFRYFPTKEDVVVQDTYDELFLAAVIAQPPGLSPVMAVRETLQAFLSQLPSEMLELERDRLMLIMATSELRARLLGTYPEALRRIAGVIAARTGRRSEDPQVRLIAGSLLGVGLAAMVGAVDDPSTNYFKLFDEGLLQLDAGLHLS